MYTITVVPITKSPHADALTYYSALAYPVGAIIEVHVRNSAIPGVVTVVEEVRTAKAALRTANFSLRRIRRQAPQSLLAAPYVRAVEQTARYHAVRSASVFAAYVPKVVLQGLNEPLVPIETHRPALRGYVVPRLFQGLASHRVEFYRSTIREAFAAKGSVIIVCPSIADAERVFGGLQGGVARYAYLLHSTQSTKEQYKQLHAVLESTHPIVLVCTPGYLSVPRQDIATIIVEREASSLFQRMIRPYVDVRTLAHEYASALGCQLFLADLPLRVDSIFRKEVGEYEEVVTGHHRMQFESSAVVLSQQGERREPKRRFRAVGSALRDLARSAHAESKHIVLFTARRGLSPVTLCGDCGTTVTCIECGAAVVLHKGVEENHFLCHACGAVRHARERCAHCNSWRLEMFGIGTELVEAEVRQGLPDATVFVLSSDTVKTHKAAHELVQTFYSTPGSVLIATEMALPYLTHTVPLVAVVSLDSMLSIASWNIYERVSSTLTRLRELAGETLALQTRHPKEHIFERALAGNFSGFYRDELRMRKHMGYPPYMVLIKIVVTGKEHELHGRVDQLTILLAPHEIITYPRILRNKNGTASVHGFLRINRESWPDDALVATLRALPPQYTVQIDPDSVL